jgi:hypothetical protein
MLWLATQAEPQMVEHAHPNLGRLIQPHHLQRPSGNNRARRTLDRP